MLFHVAALWALQSGLLRRAAEVVIPVEILSEFIEPPKPKEPPPPPPPPPPPKPQVTKAPPPPRPQAIREPKPTPAPNAPTGTRRTAPAAGPHCAARASGTAGSAARAAGAAGDPVAVQQTPTTCRTRKPVYPAMSKRLGEQGKTVVRGRRSASTGLPKQRQHPHLERL